MDAGESSSMTVPVDVPVVIAADGGVNVYARPDPGQARFTSCGDDVEFVFEDVFTSLKSTTEFTIPMDAVAPAVPLP